MRGVAVRFWGAVAVLVLLAAGTPAMGAAAQTAHTSLPATFSSAENYRVGSLPKSVVVGDFTGDGRQDVVLGTAWANDAVNDNKLFLFTQTADPTGIAAGAAHTLAITARRR